MLWTRRRTVLALWLMVVMWLYLVEIPLSYYPIPKRFGLGWYSVRVIGFISSSLVLAVLLYEITILYGRLLRAIRARRRERDARLITGDAVAATIAHEVKQPLSGMMTNAEAGFRFINRATPDLGEAKEAFRQIVADGRRATEVIGGIRALFMQEKRSRVLLDLNGLIKETITLIGQDLEKHRVTVVSELDKQLPQVRGDQIQLQQLFVNLMTNAIESMAATGEPRALSVSSEITDDRNVTISVADTGIGIASQDLERLFNPLFTTKPGNMGMGLSICRSIVEAHDGRLWVSPNTPKGSVFYFSMVLSAPA
jgi:signal transduction histidine kinase